MTSIGRFPSVAVSAAGDWVARFENLRRTLAACAWYRRRSQCVLSLLLQLLLLLVMMMIRYFGDTNHFRIHLRPLIWHKIIHYSSRQCYLVSPDLCGFVTILAVDAAKNSSSPKIVRATKDTRVMFIQQKEPELNVSYTRCDSQTPHARRLASKDSAFINCETHARSPFLILLTC